MHWQIKKFIWLILSWYSLYCGGLELNSQYLWGMLVFWKWKKKGLQIAEIYGHFVWLQNQKVHREINALECLKFLLIIFQKGKAKHLLIVPITSLVLIEHSEGNLKSKIFSWLASKPVGQKYGKKKLFFLEEFTFLWLYDPGSQFFIAD